jgi:hypothetical protein
VEKYTFKPVLDSRQSDKLCAIFSPLVDIFIIFCREKASFQDELSAKLFLLKHKNEIYHLINKNYLDETIALMSHLLVRWSCKLVTAISIRFSQGWTISRDGQIYFPIPALGLVKVALPAKLLSIKCHSKIDCIELAFWHDGFFINVYSVPRQPVEQIKLVSHKAKSSTRQADAAKRFVDRRATDAISFDAYVKMFRAAELKISRNTVRPDFDRIEGRPVSGGLPSLGKRR